MRDREWVILGDKNSCLLLQKKIGMKDVQSKKTWRKQAHKFIYLAQIENTKVTLVMQIVNF